MINSSNKWTTRSDCFVLSVRGYLCHCFAYSDTYRAPGEFCKNADLQPVIPRQSQRFCTSGMLPSDADATGLGPPLWVVRIMLHKAFPSEWTFRAQAQQNLIGISLFCASKKNVIIIRHHRSCFPSVFDYLRDGSNDGLPHLPPIHLELGFFLKRMHCSFSWPKVTNVPVLTWLGRR